MKKTITIIDKCEDPHVFHIDDEAGYRNLLAGLGTMLINSNGEVMQDFGSLENEKTYQLGDTIPPEVLSPTKKGPSDANINFTKTM